MEYNVPPVYPPPPPVPLPSARPVRRGRGWMVLALIFGAALAFLLLGDLVRFGLDAVGSGAGGHSRRWLEEVTVEDNDSPNKIAIVEVEGIITSQVWDRGGRSMVDLIADQLKTAAQDKSVRAVILKVDSPGGEVMASDQISRAILEFQEKHGKPVVAAMGGLAASGGYYVSAPCQWIVANDLTVTGSIGVIMYSLNYRGLFDKIGLYPQVFKSGRFKDMLSGTKKLEEVDPKEGEMVQAMINETYERFKDVVAKGRSRALAKNQGKGRALAEDWAQFADGRVITGTQAFEHGFVDEKGDFPTAVARAKSLANISDADLVRYQEPFRISNLFSLVGKSDATTTLKVDIGVDLPKLQAGRLYFLSSSVLH